MKVSVIGSSNLACVHLNVQKFMEEATVPVYDLIYQIYQSHDDDDDDFLILFYQPLQPLSEFQITCNLPDS